MATAPSSHEGYIARAPAEVQSLLHSIQIEVESRLPNAQRVISYGMPAYRLHRVLIYFAAFKHHIGIYPPVTQDDALIAATAAYRNEKGNLRFPLSEPLPIGLIGRVAIALSKEYDQPIKR
jgi:uncharacterized protein YdhG (YjbR/CyaY superfamily)